jgi:hypothetical protein
MQRTLLSEITSASYAQHVVAAMTERGYAVDSFVAVTQQDEANQPLHDGIVAAYAPKAVRLLRQNLTAPCHLAHRGFNRYEHRWSPLIQWVGINVCYELVEKEERRRNARYSWVLKVRSDMVFMNDIVPPADVGHVYVAEGGMARQGSVRCMSDHLFLCPRELCAPYFNLLDLFNRSDCAAPWSPAAARFYRAPNGTVPLPPALGGLAVVGWYFASQYGGGGPARSDCKSNSAVTCTDSYAGPQLEANHNNTSECCRPSIQLSLCGRVRELSIFYAIARGTGNCSEIQCKLNLVDMWGTRSSQSLGARLAALKRCTDLERRLCIKGPKISHPYGTQLSDQYVR